MSGNSFSVYKKDFKKSGYFSFFLTLFILMMICVFIAGFNIQNNVIIPIKNPSSPLVLQISEYVPSPYIPAPKGEENILKSDNEVFKVPETPLVKKKSISAVKKKVNKEIPKKQIKPLPKKEAANTPIQNAISERETETPALPQSDVIKENSEPIKTVENKSADENIKAEAAINIVREAERLKKYPKSARRAGHEGVVRLSISIGINGTVESAFISKSSGSSFLDKAASDIANKLKGLKAINNKTIYEPFILIVPIDYSLSE